MNETVVIFVGNSDNKLTQKEWFLFCKDIGMMLAAVGVQIHFAGGPDTRAQWQNYCWTFEANQKQIEHLRSQLPLYVKGYRQDSILWLQGTPELVGPGSVSP